jgi:threonine synthase
MRHDVAACHYTDDQVRETIRDVHDARGYLLDPHSAIAYRGVKEYLGPAGSGGPTGPGGRVGIFLATAHPAKFREIVEPIVGRAIQMPAPLVEALAKPPAILRMSASLEAVTAALCA